MHDAACACALKLGMRTLQEGSALLEVRFEPELGALFREGMTVTGAWRSMSDGSTRLSEPSYVYPSWYCPGGCSRQTA